MRGDNAVTVVNGVNDRGQLVGFYLDNNGKRAASYEIEPPVPAVVQRGGRGRR
jgi:hypothetical protein